jgi:hypothetical protein
MCKTRKIGIWKRKQGDKKVGSGKAAISGGRGKLNDEPVKTVSSDIDSLMETWVLGRKLEYIIRADVESAIDRGEMSCVKKFLQFEISVCETRSSRSRNTSESLTSLILSSPWFSLEYEEEYSAFYSAVPTCRYSLKIAPTSQPKTTFVVKSEGEFMPGDLKKKFSFTEAVNACGLSESDFKTLVLSCCAPSFAYKIEEDMKQKK